MDLYVSSFDCVVVVLAVRDAVVILSQLDPGFLLNLKQSFLTGRN